MGRALLLSSKNGIGSHAGDLGRRSLSASVAGLWPSSSSAVAAIVRGSPSWCIRVESQGSDATCQIRSTHGEDVVELGEDAAANRPGDHARSVVIMLIALPGQRFTALGVRPAIRHLAHRHRLLSDPVEAHNPYSGPP